KVEAKPNSVYRIASISKAITGVAVLKLVEDKKLDLDSDIRNYLPSYPKKPYSFSLRQILNHTSGLRSYRDGEFNSTIRFNTTADVVRYLAADSLEYIPGTKYLYSTLAYNLIAAIIENVSGKSFMDYMRSEIFEPAGMVSTYADYSDEIIIDRVKGYVRYDDRKIKNAPFADLTIKFPGGGFLSSVEDLLNFGIALFNGKIISQNSLNLLLETQKLNNGNTVQYGLGFAIYKDRDGKNYYGHLGGSTGFRSNFLIFPESKITVAYLINLQDGFLIHPWDTFKRIYLRQYVEPIKYSFQDTLFVKALNDGFEAAKTLFLNVKGGMYRNLYDFNPSVLDNTGRFLIARNKLNLAIKTYQLAVSETNESLNSLKGLAQSYYLDGNNGLSLKVFRKIGKKYPEDKYSRDMIRKILTF
ncbi:MAG: beta-lactamase family protein, partial [Ignavibacteriaceae bacterium]|nr:beta-lactamase family protein [Ignavibacteriaceae bacterium]